MKDYIAELFIKIYNYINKDLFPFLKVALEIVLTFFLPAFLFIIAALVVTGVDTYYGIARSKKEGKKYESKRFREGFLEKVKNWTILIIATYLFDYLVLNKILLLWFPIDLLATRIITLAIIYNEIRSVDESWVALKGYSFIDKMKETFSKLLSFKKKINE